MCPHKSWADKVEAANQKASTKEAKQVKSHGQCACLMSKKLGHPTKKCPMYKEARKEAQLQQEDAMDAMRWATRLIDVHTSKTSIEQTKAAYAMVVRERGT